MSRVIVAPAAEFPPRGSAVLEIVAADLHHVEGVEAVLLTCGKAVAEHLLEQGVRWVGVFRGDGGCAVVPFPSEEDFLQIGANAIEIGQFLCGPSVLLPFGGPDLRQKLIDAARRRELELFAAEGTA